MSSKDLAKTNVEQRQAELNQLLSEMDSETNLKLLASQSVNSFRASMVIPEDLKLIQQENLSDEEIIKQIRWSKQAKSFSRLYDEGNLQDYDGDHSRADMALCSTLAFWCRSDADMMDRIFRDSALMRPKWNQKRGANTYGQLTIAKAIELCDDHYSGGGSYSVSETVPGASRRNVGDHDGFANDAIESFGRDNLICGRDEQFRVWRNCGVWEIVSDLQIQAAILDVMRDAGHRDKIKAGALASVLKLIKVKTSRPEIEFGNPQSFINCSNGELHFKSGKWNLRPHRREHYQITQIPVVYDPLAKAPKFLKFIGEIFEGDDDYLQKGECLQELIGYTLIPGLRCDVFVLLIGTGANGKSVLLEVVRALCGKGNVSAVPLEELGDRFNKANLHGKLANIVAESRAGAVLNDAALKMFASGEPIKAEYKGKDIFSYDPSATLWYSTNNLPYLKDASYGTVRRAYAFRFNNRFEGPRRNPHLGRELAGELPGILNLALGAVARVSAGAEFTLPTSIVAERNAWRDRADQVREFINDEESEYSLGPGTVPKTELWRAYQDWASGEGIRQPVKKTTFYERVLQLDGVSEYRTATGRFFRGVTGAASERSKSIEEL